jgi:hypothetical protein
MRRVNSFWLLAVSLLISIMMSGCVERQLTINTVPSGALIELNDEQIGLSPVTVNFNWYGDYNVTVRKEGFETLKTHRELKGPWYDKFPFDFFAQILSPKKIVDKYEWSFELEPKKEVNREQLLQDAQNLKENMQ